MVNFVFMVMENVYLMREEIISMILEFVDSCFLCYLCYINDKNNIIVIKLKKMYIFFSWKV